MELSIIFIVLTSFCDASISVLSHRFYSSVYSRFSKNIVNDMWWNGEFSWKTLYRGHNPVFGRERIKILGINMNKPAFMCHATGLFRFLSHIFIVAAIVFYGMKWDVFTDFFYALLVFLTTNYFFKKLLIK